MTGTSDYLKCKFCDFMVKKWHTKKDGKKSGINRAHNKIANHVEKEHPNEYYKILKGIDGSNNE